MDIGGAIGAMGGVAENMFPAGPPSNQPAMEAASGADNPMMKNPAMNAWGMSQPVMQALLSNPTLQNPPSPVNMFNPTSVMGGQRAMPGGQTAVPTVSDILNLNSGVA